jgi:UDP-N-acetylmuramoylalanine--D-glutamate ligase
MKPRPPLPPGPYLVAGLGRSGQAVVPLLDDVIAVETDVEGLEALDRVQTVVKSPGIRPDVELIRRARERGLHVVGELEIAWRLLPNEFIAVTGTNGKTTTTELIAAIHRAAGLPVATAGNVGTALSSLVGSVAPEATIVCEVSSFQAHDAELFAPEAAVLLNLEPDHLDWHGGFEPYRDAKLRVFANQEAGDVAVVPPGIAVPGGAERVEFAPAEVRLRGAHNMQNAGAAAAVARARDIAEEAIAEALASFAGVPHRLEEVGELLGATWVNDSKATNVAATLVALAAFERGVHLILGGRGKGEDFTPLRGPVTARCSAVYLIGETAQELAGALEGTVPLTMSGRMDEAMSAAADAVQPGDVVLLSPAAASYDQFRDYEERGDRFRVGVKAMRELVGETE